MQYDSLLRGFESTKSEEYHVYNNSIMYKCVQILHSYCTEFLVLVVHTIVKEYRKLTRHCPLLIKVRSTLADLYSHACSVTWLANPCNVVHKIITSIYLYNHFSSQSVYYVFSNIVCRTHFKHSQVVCRAWLLFWNTGSHFGRGSSS